MKVRPLEGVLPVLPTPFDEKERVDLDSLAALVEWVGSKGVAGIVVLGVAGEADKLVESERRAIVQTASAARGQLTLVAGASAAGTAACRVNIENAAADGADFAMIAPAPGLRGDDPVVGYYAGVGANAPLPVVVQDFPAATGVTMSASAIARMNREIDAVVALKLEEAPTLAKLSAVRRLTDGRLPIFGGLGGVFLIEELSRGASGVMTGFAFPEVLRDVYAAFAAGETEQARRIFNRFLPLILYESQGGPGVLVRKEIYRLRGLIASNRLRAPATALDDHVSEELQRIARAVGLSFSANLAIEPRETIERAAA